MFFTNTGTNCLTCYLTHGVDPHNNDDMVTNILLQTEIESVIIVNPTHENVLLPPKCLSLLITEFEC